MWAVAQTLDTLDPHFIIERLQPSDAERAGQAYRDFRFIAAARTGWPRDARRLLRCVEALEKIADREADPMAEAGASVSEAAQFYGKRVAEFRRLARAALTED